MGLKTESLFPEPTAGRLAYWQAMAELCGKLAEQHATDGNIKGAIDNAMRMTYALTQAELLEKENENVTK